MNHHLPDKPNEVSLDRRLVFSVGLNVVIVIVEVAGGIISGSISLLSDAMHNLSDVAALAIALAARVLGRQPPSDKHSYGLARLEVLAALANSAMILVVSTLICREAVQRLAQPEHVRGGLMLVVALVGLGANLGSVMLLKGHSPSDLNMRSAFLHLLQDALSSVIVVIAAALSGLRYGPYLDPAASILVIALILRSSWGLLRDTTRILLEGTPPGIDLPALQQDICRTFPVRDLHHVHVWELKSGTWMMTAHARLGEVSLVEAERLLGQIREHLRMRWSIAHATLEAEATTCSGPAWT